MLPALRKLLPLAAVLSLVAGDVSAGPRNGAGAAQAPEGGYVVRERGVGGYSLTLHVDAPAKAENVFNALADGGTVTMKMDKTFFAERFGSVHDRFGIRWMIICEKAV